MIDANAATTLLEKDLKKISSLFPVVLSPHLHLSSCLHLILTVGHLLLLELVSSTTWIGVMSPEKL